MTLEQITTNATAFIIGLITGTAGTLLLGSIGYVLYEIGKGIAKVM